MSNLKLHVVNNEVFAKVHIEKAELSTDLQGVSKKNGKPYHIRKQLGYIDVQDSKYPVRVELPVADNALPYPAGVYLWPIDGALYISRSGDVAIARPQLINGK